jgi:hypothetical protein
MRKAHLWPEEAVEANGSTTLSVTIESHDGSRTRLWYRVPCEYASLIPANCDSFVVATVMLAMSQVIGCRRSWRSFTIAVTEFTGVSSGLGSAGIRESIKKLRFKLRLSVNNLCYR